MEQQLLNILINNYEHVIDMGEGYYGIMPSGHVLNIGNAIEQYKRWKFDDAKIIKQFQESKDDGWSCGLMTAQKLPGNVVWIGSIHNGKFYFIVENGYDDNVIYSLEIKRLVETQGVVFENICEYIGKVSLIPCISGDVRIVVHDWNFDEKMQSFLVLDAQGNCIMEMRDEVFAVRSRFHEFCWAWNENGRSNLFIDVYRGRVLWPNDKSSSYIDVSGGKMYRPDEAVDYSVYKEKRGCRYSYIATIGFSGGSVKKCMQLDVLSGKLIEIKEESITDEELEEQYFLTGLAAEQDHGYNYSSCNYESLRKMVDEVSCEPVECELPIYNEFPADKEDFSNIDLPECYLSDLNDEVPDLMVKKKINTTDAKYKICTAGVNMHIGFGKHIVIECNGKQYTAKMHSKAKGRIDGLSKLYAENNISEGTVLELNYTSKNNIMNIRIL